MLLAVARFAPTGRSFLDSSDAFGGWPRLRGGRPQSSDFEDFEWKNQAEFKRHLRDLFVGRDELKKTLLEIFTWAEDLKERREQHSSIPMTPMHTVFVGNPGTGKTTVAKIVGKMFKQFGLVQKGHVVEAQRGDLVGQNTKETAQNVEKQMQQAKGGILFVDEAYRLRDSKDAVEEIMLRLNATNDFILILAGYPQEMKELLGVNDGLPRRFYQLIQLADYKPSELAEICIEKAKGHQYQDLPSSSELEDLLNNSCVNRPQTANGTSTTCAKPLISQYNAGLCDHLLFVAEKEKAMRITGREATKKEKDCLKIDDFEKGLQKWLEELSVQ